MPTRADAQQILAGSRDLVLDSSLEVFNMMFKNSLRLLCKRV